MAGVGVDLFCVFAFVCVRVCVRVCGGCARPVSVNASVRVFETLADSAHAEERQRVGAWSLAGMAAVVALVAWSAFANNLDGAFCYDDNFAILNNGDVRHEAPLWPLFRNDFWGQAIHKADSHKSFRPLTVLSFRLNHYVGGFDPYGYRVVNNALHAAVTVLLLVVSVRVLAVDSLAAFLAALLFALHPVHTEAVSGVVGRAEALCGVLVFFALLCYSRAVRVLELHDGSRETQTRAAWFYAAIALVLAATFAKESGLTAFGILVMLDASHSSALFSARRPRESATAFLRRSLSSEFGRRIATLVAFAMAYMVFRKHICVNYTLLNNRRLENPVAFSRGITKVLSNMYLHAFYGLLLLWPYDLCFDYSFDCIPLVHTLADPRNLITLAMYGAIVALFAAAFWLRDGRGRQLLMALSLFLCPFVALSNIFFTVGSTIAERLLYLPSLGFCLVLGLAASGALWPRASGAWRVLLSALLVLLCATYVPVTLERNRVWGDEARLVRSALPVCGRSSKTLSNYGLLLRREQKNAEALAAFEQSLAILPTLCEQRFNIASTLINIGDIERGLDLLRRSANCLWVMLSSVQTMRDVYQALMQSAEANALVQLKLTDWARMMATIGRYNEAAHALQSAGTALFNLKAYREANDALAEAHELAPLPEHEHLLAIWLAHARVTVGGDRAQAIELLVDATHSNDTTQSSTAHGFLATLLQQELSAAVLQSAAHLDATVAALELAAARVESDDLLPFASAAERADRLRTTLLLEQLAVSLLAAGQAATARSLAVLAAARHVFMHGHARRALALLHRTIDASSDVDPATLAAAKRVRDRAISH